jgi:hypothetical protein
MNFLHSPACKSKLPETHQPRSCGHASVYAVKYDPSKGLDARDAREFYAGSQGSFTAGRRKHGWFACGGRLLISRKLKFREKSGLQNPFGRFMH